MNQAIEAIYEKGILRPLQPIDLREGEKVRITVYAASAESALDPAADFSDIAVDVGISDFAVNIDHYLYGLPKQTE